MHVIKINDDQSLSWIEVPDPVMHDNEVLIHIKCAAMNRADLLFGQAAEHVVEREIDASPRFAVAVLNSCFAFVKCL